MRAQPLTPHRWIREHQEHPETLEPLREPALACWWVRELHTQLRGEFGPNFDPIPGSPYEAWFQGLKTEVDLYGKPWDPADLACDLLTRQVHVYGAVCVNQLAGVTGLIAAGEYLFSVVPLVRAAVEAATTVCWLLAEEPLTPRQRASRVFADWFHGMSQLIDAVTNKATREDVKTARRRLEQTLKRLYPAEDLTLYPAGSEPLAIGGEVFPGLEERFGKLAELEGSRALNFKRIYRTLSVYSHPNAAPIELLKRADSYYIDIPSLAEVITMGLRLHHMTLVRVASFFGWPFEKVAVWEDNLAESFPGFFSSDPTQTP